MVTVNTLHDIVLPVRRHPMLSVATLSFIGDQWLCPWASHTAYGLSSTIGSQQSNKIVVPNGPRTDMYVVGTSFGQDILVQQSEIDRSGQMNTNYSAMTLVLGPLHTLKLFATVQELFLQASYLPFNRHDARAIAISARLHQGLNPYVFDRSDRDFTDGRPDIGVTSRLYGEYLDSAADLDRCMTDSAGFSAREYDEICSMLPSRFYPVQRTGVVSHNNKPLLSSTLKGMFLGFAVGCIAEAYIYK